MEQISKSNWLDRKDIPNILKKNADIIGLENYTKFTQFDLFVKFLAYVVYFNLSVFVRRQLANSAQKLAKEEKMAEDMRNEYLEDDTRQREPLQVQFGLLYFVYKMEPIWPIFNFIAKYMYLVLTICIVVLSLHWKLSVSMLLYIFILGCYYLILPFSLGSLQK
jgi:hypothetical protein